MKGITKNTKQSADFLNVAQTIIIHKISGKACEQIDNNTDPIAILVISTSMTNPNIYLTYFYVNT